MIDQGEVVARAEQATRKYHTVERHIVLGHKLKVLDLEFYDKKKKVKTHWLLNWDFEVVVIYVLVRLEPLFPVLLRVVCRNGEVANGRVEPHVEDLVLEAGQRHGRAPFQVASDTAWLQALLEPGLGDHGRRVRPQSLVDGLVRPLF